MIYKIGHLPYSIYVWATQSEADVHWMIEGATLAGFTTLLEGINTLTTRQDTCSCRPWSIL